MGTSGCGGLEDDDVDDDDDVDKIGGGGDDCSLSSSVNGNWICGEIPRSGTLSSDDGDDEDDGMEAPSVVSVPLLLVLLLPGLPPIF